MYNHNNQTDLATLWQSVLKVAAIGCVVLLTACAQTTPNLDAQFGEATRYTFKQQIINPDAGNNTDPVAGVDGRAARDAMDNYYKSFTNPEKSRDLSIGEGAARGGQ